MTYKDQFVVEVKCRGKILRVQDDIVRLPFGSEYSLYLKNLSSRKASVKISIDGQDVLDYSSLILDANSSTELEGFLRGTTAKNRFKFIQKTKEIQDHRGDKVDDGIIRVEFAYEREEVIKKTIIHEDHIYHTQHHWNYNDWFSGDSNIRYTYGNCVDSEPAGRGIVGSATGFSSMNAPLSKGSGDFITTESLGIHSLGQPLNDEGITVKGSECDQLFQYGSIGMLDPSEVIIIRLKGITGSQPIHQPITIQTKLTCPTCGRVSKSSFKFCPNCGTFLE